MSKPVEYASAAYHKIGTAYHAVVNTTLKTKVEEQTKSFSFFSMPVTRKLYAAAGQSTMYKALLVASMILPLVALLEFTVGNLGYVTIGNLLAALKKRTSEPSYKWSGTKIGIAAASVASIAALVGGAYAYGWFTPAPVEASVISRHPLLTTTTGVLGTLGMIGVGVYTLRTLLKTKKQPQPKKNPSDKNAGGVGN